MGFTVYTAESEGEAYLDVVFLQTFVYIINVSYISYIIIISYLYGKTK